MEVTIYIEPEYQRQGIGRALYARLFEILEAQGYHAVPAGITLPNEASVRRHEAFGMVQVAEFAEAGWKFERWWTVGYWQRLLQAGPPGPILPVPM